MSTAPEMPGPASESPAEVCEALSTGGGTAGNGPGASGVVHADFLACESWDELCATLALHNRLHYFSRKESQ